MNRPHWQSKLVDLLKQRSVLWVAGVRRVGKTTLCASLPGAKLYDCELPRVRQALEDAEYFFRKNNDPLIVLDEIHRLINPSEILKIAADHFPKKKVIATGSSTLAAKAKFRDTLTGRKHALWLVPAIGADLRAFNITDIDHRMLCGGLPPFLLASAISDRDYIEWIDSYWAKDLQELFRVEKRAAFLKFLELLFRQSGELFEAQSFAAPCEVSRQTIQNYLSMLETTLVAQVLRPYHEGSAVEIKSQPKVYGFDTGFVCFFKGIDRLRDEDRGHLLEHLVLGELNALYPRECLYYWRDKQQHEIDFIIKPTRAHALIAIECKAKSQKYSPSNLEIFRRLHPAGKNIVVCLNLDTIERRRHKAHELIYVPLHLLPKVLTKETP